MQSLVKHVLDGNDIVAPFNDFDETEHSHFTLDCAYTMRNTANLPKFQPDRHYITVQQNNPHVLTTSIVGTSQLPPGSCAGLPGQHNTERWFA